jgi:hypothetical protein
MLVHTMQVTNIRYMLCDYHYATLILLRCYATRTAQGAGFATSHIESVTAKLSFALLAQCEVAVCV